MFCCAVLIFLSAYDECIHIENFKTNATEEETKASENVSILETWSKFSKPLALKTEKVSVECQNAFNKLTRGIKSAELWALKSMFYIKRFTIFFQFLIYFSGRCHS